MTTLHIQNTVHDYDAWQEAFDKYERFRAEHGVRSYRISRDAADPQQVSVDLHFDSRADAEAFVPRLQQIWSTPQSQAMLVDHVAPVLLEVVRDRVLETSAVGPGTRRPPVHPEEPTCPCCLPALGDSVRYRRTGGWRRV